MAVIGGGAAGLTAGALLAQAGKRVLVVEVLGKRLGPGVVSSDMPVWDHGRLRRGSIRDRYTGDKSEPSFGVVQKPGLVGAYRPHWRAPNVDGLWFASETVRSRGVGVDRAARAAHTVVEDILGRKRAGFEGSRRYS